MGDQAIVLVRNVAAARRLLLQALDMSPQTPVLLPANVSHALLEAVKRTRARILFGDLNDDLELCTERPVRVVWAEPVLGLPTGINARAELVVLDHSDTLPQAAAPGNAEIAHADVALYGLQLAAAAEDAGALLVFRDCALAARVAANIASTERIDAALALVQLARLQPLARRQLAALALIRTGVLEAAGLPVLGPQPTAALAHGVAVRIPAESSPSTFFTYARHEHTPVAWLPELRPVHYAAAPHCPRAAANLERWLLLPVRPDDDEIAIKQTVLGIVKTAEYLGVRWRTNPGRAVQYAELINQMYGPDHDAYRPVFAIGAQGCAEHALDPADLSAPACRIQPAGPAVRPRATVPVRA